MSKPLVIASLAYKGTQRKGRGSGRQSLKAVLKYLQYRDRRNNHLAQSRDFERWQDRGLGVHFSDILANCDRLQSKHVLAWTWVISPAPDLLALVPEPQRRALLSELTERVVEDYYTERDLDVPDYSYVLHSAETNPKDGSPPQEHLHTHVILPGTTSSIVGRLPVYNNARQGHDRLFREIAAQHFSELLDERRIEWRHLRETPDHDSEIDLSP